MEFRTVLLLARTTATGIEVPPDVVEALGSSRKPAVTVTLNGGHSYPSTVASMNGKFMVPVSAEHRAAAGIEAGQEVLVDLVVDTAPRVLVVPGDLAAALDAAPAARTAFDALSYSNRRRHTLAVEGAKAAGTRARRITKVVDDLVDGRG
ncbi:YdeI/OmpD-associated family protein [Rhodococcus antarcticus]|uniref:YdeI/OmpD-associated family protein n=1 Tax=Rhodococcus antarcticus TaxID=2987751 RepID=A0ABY6NZG5_9NOCA|nr:YdeI/OmpD-associated family protein [Rhodococcus antarcticus]UZJ24797.1 YdeI/OmpD-associated family protein [Rhodococcus antarcticus]